VAWDPYNFFACHNSPTWKTPEATIGPFDAWLDANHLGSGKPRMLAQYGTCWDHNDPNRKPAWFQQLPAAVKHHPKIKGLLYFDSTNGSTPSSTTSMLLDDTPAALETFATAGHDPYFNQPHR
jgi:hypothetical protein